MANNRQAGKSQSAPGRTGCRSLVTASQVSHEDQANVAYAGVGASCDRSTTENGSSDGRSLNLVIANVPGAKETRYLNGARLPSALGTFGPKFWDRPEIPCHRLPVHV